MTHQSSARPAGDEQDVGHYLPEIDWQTGAVWCCLQGIFSHT